VAGNRITKGSASDSNDRRAQIRGLAAEMFFERGYESTTMREIAAALDIKAASLYYHFPNKEQILFELVDSVVSQLILGSREVAQREPTPELQLAALVVNHVVLHALRPRESTLGDSELRSLTGARHQANVGHRDEYEQLVIDILEGGVRAGRFDLIDPKLTAYAVIAQSSHVGTWFREPGRLGLADVAEVHVGLALRMVAAEPVSHEDVIRLVERVQAFHAEV
jgi:AcrR family transcriptional regulator